MAEKKVLAFLTKEAFEKLLTKAAQPKKKPSTEAEQNIGVSSLR